MKFFKICRADFTEVRSGAATKNELAAWSAAERYVPSAGFISTDGGRRYEFVYGEQKFFAYYV